MVRVALLCIANQNYVHSVTSELSLLSVPTQELMNYEMLGGTRKAKYKANVNIFSTQILLNGFIKMLQDGVSMLQSSENAHVKTAPNTTCTGLAGTRRVFKHFLGFEFFSALKRYLVPPASR